MIMIKFVNEFRDVAENFINLITKSEYEIVYIAVASAHRKNVNVSNLLGSVRPIWSA